MWLIGAWVRVTTIVCRALAEIDPRPPLFEVSTSDTIRRTSFVGLIWTRDQLAAVAATYTTQKKRKRRTSMSSAWFEPAMPVIVRTSSDLRLTKYGHQFRQVRVNNI
jgi:hypothetical protein